MCRIVGNYMDFPPGGVPVRVAAAVYGKPAGFVVDGIRQGWLPVGHARPGGTDVYISPRKLWEDTGFLYQGQTPEEITGETE